MSSSLPVAEPGLEATSGSGAYVSLPADAATTPARKEQSPAVVASALTAVSFLLFAAISIPLYLFYHSTASSSSDTPNPHSIFHQVPPNSSQYGSYPMLYLDPRNQWTPQQGFLFNQSTVDIDFNKVALQQYRGNITLVTNVASF